MTTLNPMKFYFMCEEISDRAAGLKAGRSHCIRAAFPMALILGQSWPVRMPPARKSSPSCSTRSTRLNLRKNRSPSMIQNIRRVGSTKNCECRGSGQVMIHRRHPDLDTDARVTRDLDRLPEKGRERTAIPYWQVRQ